MTETLFIFREDHDNDPLSFTSLRRLGIEYAQRASGELWTDFNDHDPGVTVLEQAIFALTELNYLLDRPIIEHLVGDGTRHWHRSGLQAPEAIYPCRATTLSDIRILLLDAIPQIQDVWVTRVKAENGSRLELLLHLREQGNMTRARVHELETTVYAQVSALMSANRSMCETKPDIQFVSEANVQLHASVELDDAANAPDVVASIYLQCRKHLETPLNRLSLSEAKAKGYTAEAVFTGPKTRSGYFSADPEMPKKEEEPQHIPVASFYANLRQLPGVKKVHYVRFYWHGHDVGTSLPLREKNVVTQIAMPVEDDQIHVIATRNGRQIPVGIDELSVKADQIFFRNKAQLKRVETGKDIFPLPAVKPNALGPYHSIQNHFPAVYGVGHYGLPKTASADTQLKSTQLKGYLGLFDQRLSYMHQLIGHLNQVFSIDFLSDESSFHDLTKAGIQNYETLQRSVQTGERYSVFAEQGINASMEQHSRLLDHLLSLYGEEVTGDAMAHFNPYFPEQEVRQRLLRQKMRMLDAIVEITQNRTAPVDLYRLQWRGEPLTGFLKRCALLLDVHELSFGSVANRLLQSGFEFGKDDDETWRKLRSDIAGLRASNTDSELGEPVPWQKVDEQTLQTLIRQLREQWPTVFAGKGQGLPGWLFRSAATQSNFRLVRATDDAGVRVVLWNRDAQSSDDRSETLYSLGTFSSTDEAVSAVNTLRSALVQMNLASEGLHLVEHPLLRSVAGFKPLEDLEKAFGFASQCSIVLAGWSARCADLHFRQYAQELIRQQAPAHVFVHVIWLDFADMATFESLYARWVKAYRDHSVDVDVLDRAAWALANYLSGHWQSSVVAQEQPR